MTGWSDFAVVTGSAAAALMGLLFVAVTLRIDVIARAADLRSRAAQTLILFAVALVTSIVVPGQPAWVLGVDLMVVAGVGGAAMLALNRRAKRVSQRAPVARVLEKVGPNLTTIAFVGSAGALITAGVEWGSFLLVPAQLAALIGGVVSAWLFLTSG